MLVERIVFMQGKNAREALSILDNDGKEAVLEHLKQWHYPGEHETSDMIGAGSSDRTIRTNDNYVLSYHLRLGYISLEYILSETN